MEYHIPYNTTGKLHLSPAPQANSLEKTIKNWHAKAHIELVINLLPKQETKILGIDDEEQLVKKHTMQFQNYAIQDLSIPTETIAFKALAHSTIVHLNEGNNVLIHCRAGIGRSGLLALTVGYFLGFHFEEANRILTKARGCKIPETEEQKEWLLANVFN